jgi:hypothetical protein
MRGVSISFVVYLNRTNAASAEDDKIGNEMSEYIFVTNVM